MRRRWFFYDAKTGRFNGQSISAKHERDVAANTPSGCAAIEGDIDPLSQCVDIATGGVVDYQPPQPDADHVWNPSTRRWEKRASIQTWEHERATALARLAELDLKRSRALSDHALRPNERAGKDMKLPRERLEAIDMEADGLRAILDAPKPVNETDTSARSA